MGGEGDVLQRLSTALDELAAADAGAVLEEARVEARIRVRALLAEALAERMLAQAEDELGSGGRARLRGRDVDAAHGRGPTPAREPGPRTERAPVPPGGPVATSLRRETEAAEPSAAAAHPAAPDKEALGWYVYGIVGENFDAPPLRGVDESHALEVVRAAGLGALASRVSLREFGEQALQARMEDLTWLERQARHHEQILDGVREQRATVVPMRLFTIYESEASLAATLERERVFLAAALGRLADRTEWGVKLFAIAGPGSGSGSETRDEAAEEQFAEDGHDGPGQSYMRRRRAADARREEIGQRFEQLRELAHSRLAGLSVEARVNPLQPPELSEHDGTMLLNGVYLVENDTAEDFSAEVGALRDEYAREGIEVVLTGPWPPYNFVNPAQEAEV